MIATNRTAVGLAVSAALALSASCAQRPAAAPTGADKKAPSLLDETRQSATFGYAWTLPATWEFFTTENAAAFPPDGAVDVLYARAKGTGDRYLMVLVTNLVSTIADGKRALKPGDYDDLVRVSTIVLSRSKAEVTSAERVRMLGIDGAEVNGARADGVTLSIRTFHHGRQSLQFRCYYVEAQAQWPCVEALVDFKLTEPRGESPESNQARVIHLREGGMEFDAPDDSWLAIGPRLGGGGAQRVWVWRKNELGIDVQLYDLSRVPVRPDEEDFVEMLVSSHRADGSTVVVNGSTLAGKPCHHLQIDRRDGWKQDAFMLFVGDTNYALLITEPKRDKRFIETVKRGFRLTRDVALREPGPEAVTGDSAG